MVVDLSHISCELCQRFVLAKFFCLIELKIVSLHADSKYYETNYTLGNKRDRPTATTGFQTSWRCYSHERQGARSNP